MKNIIRTTVVLCCAWAAAAWTAGCAGTRGAAPRPLQTTLTVTQVGGDVTLGWQSEKGVVYNVLCADSLASGARWSVMPGGEGLVGTGEYMVFKDSGVPGDRKYYRLHVTHQPAP